MRAFLYVILDSNFRPGAGCTKDYPGFPESLITNAWIVRYTAYDIPIYILPIS